MVSRLDYGEAAAYVYVPGLDRIPTSNEEQMSLEAEAGNILTAEDVLLKQPHSRGTAVNHHVASVKGVLLCLVGHNVVFIDAH